MIADRPAASEGEFDTDAMAARQPPHQPSTAQQPQGPRLNQPALLRSVARRMERFCFGETDLLPVGLFRILFGLQLCNWFWQVYPDLTAFFTEDGLLTAEALRAMRPHDFTVLAFASQPWQVFGLWLLGVGAAALLTVGYRTRIASVLLFVALALFTGRDPLILDGSDVVMRIVPLWLAFTAAGDCLSLDAVLRRQRGVGVSARGPALPVRVLELQVAWIYLASGIEKLAGSTWLDGTATSWVFQLTNTYARPWAAPLASSPDLVRLTTWGTLALELGFLPLVFAPVWSRAGRWIAIAAAATLHLGILACMNVGNFPVVMLSLLVLFVPLRSPSKNARLFARPSRLPLETTVVLCVLAFSSLLTAMPFVPGSGSSLLARVGLTQRWDMFAPDPTHSDSSLLVLLRFEDGSTAPLTPAAADPFYSRWQKVGERARATPTPELGAMFCRAMRTLNPAHKALQGLNIVSIDRTLRPAGAEPVVAERTLWSGTCT